MQAVRNISGPPTGGGSDDDVDGPDTVCHLFNTWTGTWPIIVLYNFRLLIMAQIMRTMLLNYFKEKKAG